MIFIELMKIGEFTKELSVSIEQLRIYSMKINGCLGCDYCRRNEEHACIQKDDMEQINRKILESDMVVFATPVYYFNFSAPLLATIQRTYSIDIPKNIKQTALIYSAGSAFTGGPVLESYFHSIVEYWNVRNAGIWESSGKLNRYPQKEEELYQAGLHLQNI